MAEERYARDEAIACFRALAGTCGEEAADVARILEAGAVPDSISERLFGELMRLSAPGELATWVRDSHSVNQMESAGEDASEAEASCRTRIAGANAFMHLVQSGFAPSPPQRTAIAARLSEILSEERPFETGRPHLSHGAVLARSICHNTLRAIPHLLDRGQCALVIEACRSPSASLDFIRSWTERASWQSDIAALMEGELTKTLREGGEPPHRLEAFRLRAELGKMEKRIPAGPAAGKECAQPKRVI